MTAPDEFDEQIRQGMRLLHQETARRRAALRELAKLQPDGLSMFHGIICLDYENPDDRERAFDLLEGLFSTPEPEPRP